MVRAMGNPTTLEIRWPLCHVPTVDGQTPLVNLKMIGTLIAGKMQPQGAQGRLMVGQRDVVLLVIGAAQLPVEVEVAEAIRLVLLEHADEPVEVPLGAEAPTNGASEQKPDLSLT